MSFLFYGFAGVALTIAACLVITKIAAWYILMVRGFWKESLVAGAFAISDLVFTTILGLGAAHVSPLSVAGFVAGLAGVIAHFILGSFIPHTTSARIKAVLNNPWANVAF